jgi:hypothetical protein
VPKAEQQDRSVSLAAAVVLGDLDQLLDLPLCQVLARTNISVGLPARRNCPIF